jgi:hypothetical protein
VEVQLAIVKSEYRNGKLYLGTVSRTISNTYRGRKLVFFMNTKNQAYGFPTPAFPDRNTYDEVIRDVVDFYATATPTAEVRGTDILTVAYSGGVSVEDILAEARWVYNQGVRACELRMPEVLPDLHASSFDGIQKFQGNFLVLLSKLQGAGLTTLNSIADLAGSGMSIQDFARYWLANRYGDRLALGGIADLISAFDKEFLSIKPYTVPYLVGKARTTSYIEVAGNQVAAYFSTMVALKPRDYNELMRLIRTAYEWDFYPSLGNTWDAIPLSFVVDWFINVSDIYNSVDRIVQAQYYDVLKVMNTYKCSLELPSFPQLRCTIYNRSFSSNMSLTTANLSVGLPNWINMIDGLSLIAG